MTMIVTATTAWAERAEELADWATRLINRTDVWGGYLPLARRGEQPSGAGNTTSWSGPYTRPPKRRRGKEQLTEKVLRSHFCATRPEHVVGLHTTSPENTSKWGATEIDWHGEQSTDPATISAAAASWHDQLRGRGFHPLLIDSNGKGGVHLRVHLTEPIATSKMFWFLRTLTDDFAAQGLAARPEVFPKQSAIKAGKFGNWLRLPGRHHTREHHSRVWSGSEWFAGHEAIDSLLALPFDPPSLIPEDIEWDYRIRRYLDKLPVGMVEASGRDDVAYNLLAFMVRDLHLPDDYALSWASRWDSENRPPKGPERLRQILANVHQYGQHAYGHGLNGDRGRCSANGDTRKPDNAQPANDDCRPLILVTTEEHEVNDKAVEALTADPGVYQRGGSLVHVVREPEQTVGGIMRPAGTPRVVDLPVPVVRERLSAVARWMAYDVRSEKFVGRHPPDWCVSAVAARGQWPGIRRLDGVVDAPVLRPDGTILADNGYDPATGLILESRVRVPAVHDRPMREDVEEARDTLLGVVADFPFKKPEHRATWLAALLTPLARFAFSGPSPLFLVDANTPGSGKGLLVDTTALIVTGRPIPIMSCPRNDEEFRKRITSLALSGDLLVNIDNIAGALGCASLDAALTATVWKDRVLGKSEMTTELPLRATWFATGNNTILLADTARRTAHIRIESKDENPEERSGFAHPDLRRWVQENRGAFLGAGLTILRGYCGDGRPSIGLKPWGSYEGWSDLVRSAVVWCGLPDPGATRQEVRDRCDQEAGLLRAMIAAIDAIDAERKGVKTGELLDQLFKLPYCSLPESVALKEALTLAFATKGAEMPTARQVGMKLRHLEGRVVGDKRIVGTPDRFGTVWRVDP